jgi:DNA polymerase-1
MPTDTFSAETQEKYKGNPIWKPWMTQVRLRQITSLEELEEIAERAENKKVISWDIETTSLNPDPKNIVGHCLAIDSSEGVYIPVAHQHHKSQNLPPDKVWDLVMRIIEKPRVVVVYNWMFEGMCLRKAGIKRPCKLNSVKDVMIYVWLYDSNEKKLNLKYSTHKYLGFEMLELREIAGVARDKKKTGEIDWSHSDPEDGTLYAAADPVMALKLLEYMEPKVVQEQDQGFIVDLEHSLMEPLFSMMENPVTIDRAFLARSRLDLIRYIDVLAAEIYEKATYQFNIGSPAEVGQFLVKQGLALNKTKTGKIATGAKEIEKLAEQHPIVERVLLWRSLVKELGTYIDPLYNGTSEENPRAVFKFKSVGAPTGRFSAGGVEKGESQFLGVNVQAIPSASAYKEAPAWLVKNPPTQDMDAVIAGVNSVSALEGEDEGDLTEDL